MLYITYTEYSGKQAEPRNEIHAAKIEALGWALETWELYGDSLKFLYRLREKQDELAAAMTDEPEC